MKGYESIFKPIQVGPITLKNRIDIAPATPFLASHDSTIGVELMAHMRALAGSGAAVVTTGVTGVDGAPGVAMRTPTLGSDFYASDWEELSEMIHGYDAATSVELVHSRFMLTPPELFVTQISTEEVEGVIAQFAAAAKRAMDYGFDMVLIHGGHGNVPSMFFNKKFNRRTDRFGGSLEKRANFAIELLQAVRAATDGKLAIEYRISAEECLPDMTTFDETLEFAKLVAPHIDLLHVSRGLLEEHDLLPIINAPLYVERGANLPFAKELKKAIGKPVTVVGSFNLEMANEAIAAGDVDMVSMIRTIYADNECVEKARIGEGDKIRPCVRCNNCISRTHFHFIEARCSVNPLLGRESRFDLRKSDSPKKVAVIGGGPAGLEAARQLSNKGHSVTLFEKGDELGGMFILASAASFKQDMRKYLDWSIADVLARDNVDVRLNEEATVESVKALEPDAVFLAMGSVPILPKFTASGTSKVIWAGDAELDSDAIGEDVVIAGAGFTGMELGLALLRLGKKVTLVDMLP
ncbi:MAG: FAD-dependent oxidoreductase, partial [bacterium]|nr:FAD-dependent oxidoreductase [bacterium]